MHAPVLKCALTLKSMQKVCYFHTQNSPKPEFGIMDTSYTDATLETYQKWPNCVNLLANVHVH